MVLLNVDRIVALLKNLLKLLNLHQRRLTNPSLNQSEGKIKNLIQLIEEEVVSKVVRYRLNSLSYTDNTGLINRNLKTGTGPSL